MSCKTGCKARRMHGGSTSVITPAAYPQGAGWSDPANLPGSAGRNVSQAGNHFSLNTNAGAMPDPANTSGTNQCGGGTDGCACNAPVGGRKKKKSPKKRGTKRLVSVCKKKCTRKCYAGGKKKRKGRKGKKSRRRTKKRKGKKSRRRTKGRKGKSRRHGRKARRTKRRMRGGGFFDDRSRVFQPATNAFRQGIFGAGDLVNQWRGKKAPFNPAPTVQDRLTPMDNVVLPSIPDIPGIHAAAGQAVANI